MIRSRLLILEMNTTDVMCPPKYIVAVRQYVLSAGNACFDNMIQVMSDRFLHCEATILVPVINKYLERKYS